MAVLATSLFIVLGLAAQSSAAMATELEPSLAKDFILDTSKDPIFPNWHYDHKLVIYLDSDENLTSLNNHTFYGNFMPSKSYWKQFHPTSGIWAILHPTYVYESPTPTINFTSLYGANEFELMTIRCHLFGEALVEVRVNTGKEVVGQIASECKSEGDCRTKGFQDFDLDLRMNGDITKEINIIFKTVNESDFILVDKIMLFAKLQDDDDTSESSTTSIPVCADYNCTPENLLNLEQDFEVTNWSNNYPEHIQYFDTGSEAYNAFLASHNAVEPTPALPPIPEPEVAGAQGVWLFSSDSTNGTSPHFFLGNIGSHVSTYRPVLRVAFEVYLADANASVVLGVMNREKEWNNFTAVMKADGESGFQTMEYVLKGQDIVAIQLWPVVLTNTSFVLINKLEAEVDCESNSGDDYTDCELEEDEEVTTSTMPEPTETGSTLPDAATSPKPSTESPDLENSTSGATGSTTSVWLKFVVVTAISLIIFQS